MEIKINSNELTEKGFIFLDDNSNVYLCRLWNGEPWLFYGNIDKKWVSVRKVSLLETSLFPKNLSEKEQGLYFDRNNT